MVSPLPQCIGCKTFLVGDVFNRADLIPCPNCGAPIQVELFPAFFRPLASGQVGEQIMFDSEAGCFFHPEKKAKVPCQGCGRFLCGLCDCELNGQHFCPGCLEAGRKKGKIQSLENQRTLYDSIALALAVLPVILIFGIYFTFITAPLALYMAIRHWNSPRSIVHRTRIRYVLAIVFAALQLIGWVVAVYFIIAAIRNG